jgi:hypothetical protein
VTTCVETTDPYPPISTLILSVFLNSGVGRHIAAVLHHLLVADHVRPVRARAPLQEEDQRTEGADTENLPLSLSFPGSKKQGRIMLPETPLFRVMRMN